MRQLQRIIAVGIVWSIFAETQVGIAVHQEIKASLSHCFMQALGDLVIYGKLYMYKSSRNLRCGCGNVWKGSSEQEELLTLKF